MLYVVGQLHGGGAERQLCYLLQATDRARYKPAVAVWNYDEKDVHVPLIRALGVPIYAIANGSSRIEKLFAFRRLIMELRPDVIHSYSFYTNFAAYWGALGTRAVAVGSVRCDFVWEKKQSGPLLGRLSGRWPAHQISNSFSAVASARSSNSLFVPKTIDVVSNGLDLGRFRNFEIETNGRVRILGLGYLLPQKHWERLLNAASELKRRGLDFDIRIVGDGPQRRILEERAQSLDVADRVQFMPHSDDVPGLFANSAFLAHTSASEGCPNVVMEAMACGRAVVATDAGDVPLLVDDGKTGFLVPSGDEQLLVERLTQLITDRKLCRAMGEAARRRAERNFGLERLIQETLASYRKAGWTDEGADCSGVRTLS
jgi:glycosyltransferase involved in cell wall biosynthesis